MAICKEGAQSELILLDISPAENPKYIMAVRLDYPKKCFVSWADFKKSV
jgi:cell division protein FtsI (penicillin-binding protein 3)